jgi:hypothetical protein
MSEFNLNRAPKVDLEAKALEIGIDPEGKTAMKLREEIAAALGEPLVVEQSKPQSKIEAELKKQKRVKITISPDDNDSQPVFVGVNGVGFSIDRGREVEVPASVVEVLRHAIKKVPVKEGHRVVGWREVQMYPFQVVG